MSLVLATDFEMVLGIHFEVAFVFMKTVGYNQHYLIKNVVYNQHYSLKSVVYRQHFFQKPPNSFEYFPKNDGLEEEARTRINSANSINKATKTPVCDTWNTI